MDSFATIASSRLSASVSTRLTKNDATDAIVLSGSPRLARSSSAARYDSITEAYASREKSSVMLTLMPSARRRRAAAAPSAVPGTLIITFGRSTSAHSRRASEIVSSTLCAAPGDTSIDT